MNLKITSVVIVFVAVLLLAQSITVVEAHHKEKDNGEIRKSAEAKSKEYDAKYDNKVTKKSATSAQKSKAFLDYKGNFTVWKSAKELWKIAKSSGIESNINGNKTLVDVAKISKDVAWKTYQEVKNKKLR